MSSGHDIIDVDSLYQTTGTKPNPARLQELKDTLFEECGLLAKKYGLCGPNGDPRTSMVLSQIASSSRLCCVTKALRNRISAKIDPYYLSKHDFAANLIAEALNERLTSLHYEVRVDTEVHRKPGRYDIILEPCGNGPELSNHNCEIGIEVKTGLSIDVAQLIRYIIDVDTLILARTQPKQVAVIRQKDLIAPLSAIISIWISRTSRLLADAAPICSHEEHNGPQYFLSGKALESDILTFIQALTEVVNSILEHAMAELRTSGLIASNP
jgi:hypothetical protein